MNFRFFYNFNAYLESSLRCDGEYEYIFISANINHEKTKAKFTPIIVYISPLFKRISLMQPIRTICTDAKFKVNTKANKIPISKKLTVFKNSLYRLGFM